jgi:hypothetical protein
MKTGVIVYVPGNLNPGEIFDEKVAAKNLEIRADRVEFVFSGEKSFDVSDAWWRLTAKGMHRIVCMIGEIAEHSGIRLTGRELQLCAY